MSPSREGLCFHQPVLPNARRDAAADRSLFDHLYLTSTFVVVEKRPLNVDAANDGDAAAEGHAVNRKRIRRLTRRMDIAARSARSRAPASRQRGTRYSHICCAAWRLSERTRSGRR